MYVLFERRGQEKVTAAGCDAAAEENVWMNSGEVHHHFLKSRKRSYFCLRVKQTQKAQITQHKYIHYSNKKAIIHHSIAVIFILVLFCCITCNRKLKIKPTCSAVKWIMYSAASNVNRARWSTKPLIFSNSERVRHRSQRF